MNGYKLLEDAAKLLGLDRADDNMKIIGLPLVNEIITELGFVPIDSLSEKIGTASPAVCSAMRFGVAALMANAVGDTVLYNTLAQTFNQKRSTLASKIEKVRDVLPRGEQ